MTIEWTNYTVRVKFCERGVSGWEPLTRTLVRDYATLVATGESNILKASRETVGEVSEAAIEKYLESNTSIVPWDENGFYCCDYQFLAMLRRAATRTGWSVRRKGILPALKESAEIIPKRIHLATDCTHFERPSPIGQGRSVIKIFNVVYPGEIELTFRTFERDKLDDEVIKDLWIAGQLMGVGSQRPLGYGKYTLLGLERDGTRLIN